MQDVQEHRETIVIKCVCVCARVCKCKMLDIVLLLKVLRDAKSAAGTIQRGLTWLAISSFVSATLCLKWLHAV